MLTPHVSLNPQLMLGARKEDRTSLRRMMVTSSYELGTKSRLSYTKVPALNLACVTHLAKICVLLLPSTHRTGNFFFSLFIPISARLLQFNHVHWERKNKLHKSNKLLLLWGLLKSLSRQFLLKGRV